MDEVIDTFNRNGVRYLLMGGQAVRLEGLPRFSLDWDLYIPPHDTGNLARINELLTAELEEPLVPLGDKGENFVQTYQTRWGVLQFHLGGPGLPPFDVADERSVTHETEGGVQVRCLCLQDLLESKRRAGRPEDQADIRFLEKRAEAERER